MKVTNIVVFCAGAQSKVIMDMLRDRPEYNIVGIIDSIHPIGSQINGHRVIGRQNELNTLCSTYDFQSGVVGLGDNYLREKVVLEILRQIENFNFINVVSKFSYISPTATMGVGNVIMPGAVVNSEAVITDHCMINTNSVLEHNGFMDHFSSLSVGVTTGGYFNMGRYSTVGLGVTILDRTSIGENVFVGSGSLVTKDLESNGLYYGSPAKWIRPRKPFENFLK